MLLSGVALTACVQLPPPPPPDPRLFIVGDSVSLGAQPAIAARVATQGWSVTQISIESLHTWQANAIIDAHRAAIGEVAIVELGTNDGGDPQFATWIDGVMQHLQGVARVYWMNMRQFRPWAPTANQMIVDATNRWPNLRIINWDAVATPHPGLVYGDGYHLNPEGQGVMGDVVAETLAGYLQERRRPTTTTTTTLPGATTTSMTTAPTGPSDRTGDSDAPLIVSGAGAGLVVGGLVVNLAARKRVRRWPPDEE